MTDILNNDSTAVAIGQVAEAAAKGFGAELVNNRVILPGIVSRKKTNCASFNGCIKIIEKRGCLRKRQPLLF